MRVCQFRHRGWWGPFLCRNWSGSRSREGSGAANATEPGQAWQPRGSVFATDRRDVPGDPHATTPDSASAGPKPSLSSGFPRRVLPAVTLPNVCFAGFRKATAGQGGTTVRTTERTGSAAADSRSTGAGQLPLNCSSRDRTASIRPSAARCCSASKSDPSRRTFGVA